MAAYEVGRHGPLMTTMKGGFVALFRRIVPLALAALLAAVALVPPPSADATPVPPELVGSSADFRGFVNGRFLILNMHGGFSHPTTEPVEENIRYAAWMNAGAIRIFATDSAAQSVEYGEALGNRIADVAPALRANQIKLIVALVNNHQEVPGEDPSSVGWKDGYWQHLLPFFRTAWRGPYLDFSRRLIRTVRDRGALDVIQAWEFGNELHTQDDPARILEFLDDMAGEIRQIDPRTPMWPGFMGTHHLDPHDRTYAIASQVYCTAPIAAYTLHTYDWLGPHSPGDMPIDWDLNSVVTRPCANGRKLPVVVEELGTSRGVPGVWGPDEEWRRVEHELFQIRTFLAYSTVVGIGAWSAESPLNARHNRRFDNRRGLTSFGPNRDGSGSCYPPAGHVPGARCRLETALRNLPAMP